MYITVQLHLLLFLIFYPLSCHMYILLHFLILVTLYVVTHYSCIRILCIPCILFHVHHVDIATVSSQYHSIVILHTSYLNVQIHHDTIILLLLLD